VKITALFVLLAAGGLSIFAAGPFRCETLNGDILISKNK
jgi:hypothetical protein